MATNVIYVHNLPFQPRNQLCRILDADKRWEELGGRYMGYDITTLTLIGQSIHRDKSPTWELLNKYSERNGTIKRLFLMLCKMDHQRAMSVLMPYVDQKYSCLLENESSYTTTLYNRSKKEEIPRPSVSQLSITTTNSLSHVSHSSLTHKNVSGTINSCFKEKENFSTVHSKMENNLANINQNFSSVSLKSKLKSLNVCQEECSAISSKKSSDVNQFKKNAYSKEENVSVNCVSEKIKNCNKKPSVQMIVNGKQLKHHDLASGANFSSRDDSLPDIMHIPFREICKATDNFNDTRILGRGGFGTVYKGEWKGTSVAIKRLTPRKSSDSPSQQHVSLKQSLNELNILKCCRFDHILPLYAVCLDGVNPCLIYQLMVNGSLEDRLLCKNKTPPLTWLQRSHIAECTSKGLNYLHTTYEKPLVHGDIKSANILLDSNMEAKIGDFGLTREGPGCDNTHVKVTSVHGTECYLPPEYLRQRHLSPQVDIYSYGIVLLEIATGLRPFDPKREAKRLVDYVRLCHDSGRLDSLRDTKAGEENMLWFRELIKIGQICSSTEKKKRWSMQEVLDNFKKVEEEYEQMKIIFRRFSNEKNTRVSPDIHLTPLEIQIIYDNQKEGRSAVSENNKLMNIAPDNAANSNIPLVIDQMKNLSQSSKDSESRFESLERRDSYISSDSSSESETQSSVSSNMPEICRLGSCVKEDNGGADLRVPPVPLLTLLNMQVSEFNGDTVESVSGNS